MLKELDDDGNGTIDQEEIVALLDHSTADEVLGSLLIDPQYLLNYLEMLYEGEEALPIQLLMEIMLQLRGDRQLTIKDAIDISTYTLWVLTGRSMSQQPMYAGQYNV